MWKFSAHVYNLVATYGNMPDHPKRVYDLVYLKTNRPTSFNKVGFKLFIIIVEQRVVLSPRLGHFWTELGKQISCVLSFFLSLFSTFVCVYNFHTLCFDCLIITCSTYQVFYWCDFHRIHNNWHPLWGKGQRIIKYHGSEVGY